MVNSILAGFKSLHEYKVLMYTTASKLSVLWQTLMIQLLAYGHPVLSIIVSLVVNSLPSSLKVELNHPVLSIKVNQSVLSLESCSKSYSYVGEMIHICWQNESRRIET